MIHTVKGFGIINKTEVDVKKKKDKKKTKENSKYFWKIGSSESMLCGLRLKNIVSRVTAFLDGDRSASVNL